MTAKKRRNDAAPLSAELLVRLLAIRAIDDKERFGVSTSTLGRALSGFPVMGVTRKTIEAALAGMGGVARGTEGGTST